MSSSPENTGKCAFWSNTGKRCTAAVDGLFIPDERHIVDYCTSHQFRACRIYCRAQDLQKRRESVFPANRRKDSRIPVRYPVVLQEADLKRNSRLAGSRLAGTIDFSNGGLQISSRKPLHTQELLRVIYGGTTGSSRHEDLVQVRWCHFLQESKSYRAGLSFHSCSAGNGHHRYGSFPP